MEYKVTNMEEVNENMWNEVYQQGADIIVRFFDKGILLLSFIFGIFLGAIGYPKEVIAFITILTIIDILTKHLSIVVENYGSLSFSNYITAWKERILTSRQLKNGVCVKTIMYGCLLYISNQLGIIDGILFGKEISGVLYSAIVLVEISSVLENLIAMGNKSLSPILDFVKDKQKQLFKIKSKENENSESKEK